jgi:DNA-binding MarR family transcriptional regulator
MKTDNIPAEEQMLSLFRRMRKLGLGDCPNMIEAISPAQMTLLEQIVVCPGCGVQDISERLTLSPPTVSVGVNKLEERGLVERKPNPTDKRSIQFFVTEKGQFLHNKIHDARLRKFRRLLSGLDSKDQQTLLTLLTRALTSAEKKINLSPPTQ